MNQSVRDFNTGFISLQGDPKIDSSFKKQFLEIFDFLKRNNPLYEGIDSLREDTMAKFVLTLKDKVGASEAILLPDQSDLSNHIITSKEGDSIMVKISRKDDGETILLPFEVSLASLFPTLFPFGPLPSIPGKTLREKTKCLLLSHERFRVGPVASQLILFCFDLIVGSENYNFQKYVKPKQPEKGIPKEARTIPISSIIRKDDPSFGLYWHNQLQAVNAYCEQFGNPDLMVTLTFGNKWEECINFVNYMKNKYKEFNTSNFNMEYCGVESMYYFKERLSGIRKQSFNNFLKY